jgi:multiple sugar transport system permease protein
MNQKQYVGYLYILPSFILLFVFTIVPIFMSFYFSFTKYNVFQPAIFVGLDNFVRMLKDPYVKKSLMNTILFAVITVPIQTFLALGIASSIAAKAQNSFGMILRGVLFIPVIVSLVSSATIWGIMFSTDSGILNMILNLFAIDKINWLGQKTTAFFALTIVIVWKFVGYFVVIYYAGLMEVPRSLYEAAEIDGATQIQRFIRITIPILKPITFLVITLGIIWSFQIFDLPYVMTGGGPGNSTMTLGVMIYNAGFKEYSMGYASAISVLLFVFIVCFSIIQRYLFAEKD